MNRTHLGSLFTDKNNFAKNRDTQSPLFCEYLRKNENSWQTKKIQKNHVTLSLQSRSMSTHYHPSMHGLDIFTGEQTMLWARCVAQCSLFRTKTMASGCVMVLYVLLNYIFTKSQGTDIYMYSSTFGHFGAVAAAVPDNIFLAYKVPGIWLDDFLNRIYIY